MSEEALNDADLEILDWLGRTGLQDESLATLVDGFCERLCAAGLPLKRVQIGTAIVHPAMRGFAVTWWAGRGLAEGQSFGHDQAPAPEWYRSPGAYMFENQLMEMTAQLDGNQKPSPWFPLYDDLREQGLTGYYTAVFPFGWSSTADRETRIPELGVMSSWSTDRPGGFGGELARLRRLLPLFALALKGRVLADMADSLMTTYLGEDAGRRVLHGEIHRGDTHAIRAAILLADLRGFTALADRMDTGKLVALLNEYLDAICAPVRTHGGQVLKFLGDGLLAVFGDDTGNRADAALHAARESLARVEAINRERQAEGLDVMPLDIALHAGEVAYGNVGGRDRLEFTVIGPAVNEAARMEAMCGDLGRHLLMSADLAAELPDRAGLADLGEHRLRGLERPRRLYGLDADA